MTTSDKRTLSNISSIKLIPGTMIILLALTILGFTGCLSSTANKTISIDSDNLKYDNPLLESAEIKEKTKNDIPSPESNTSPIAGVAIEKSPFAENPNDLPEPETKSVPSPQKKSTIANNNKKSTQTQQSTKNTTPNSKNQQTKKQTLPQKTGKESSSTAASTSSAINQSEEKRPIIAEVKEEDGDAPFSIDLAGRGWVFRQKKDETRAVNYIGKENTAKGTRFKFSLPEKGSYLLTFVQQNNITGIIKAYDVSVIIGSQDFNSDNSIETQKNNSNISPSEAIEKAITEKNYSELNRLLNLHINNPTIPVKLLNGAYKALTTSGNYDKMRLLLLYTLEKRGDGDVLGLAFYYYEMAGIYEQPGKFKDIKRAYNLYKKVYDNYPISLYSGKSKKRMDYLERHFLKVY